MARRYRKKPLVQFEHGTRIYAPSGGESRYRARLAECKIAYVDETGIDGGSPALVMVGVVADTVRAE